MKQLSKRDRWSCLLSKFNPQNNSWNTMKPEAWKEGRRQAWRYIRVSEDTQEYLFVDILKATLFREELRFRRRPVTSNMRHVDKPHLSRNDRPKEQLKRRKIWVSWGCPHCWSVLKKYSAWNYCWENTTKLRWIFFQWQHY